MFMIAGPGSPSVLTNVIVSIEQHVDWLADLLVATRERGAATVEADPEAESRRVEHVNAAAAATLYPEANSWYLSDGAPGRPRVFMPYVGGVRGYRRTCERSGVTSSAV
jgi:cyclohexanone monooxygenase